jgi:hypothetical protein
VLLTEIHTLDALLGEHAAALGSDYDAYRNHTYRVVNVCAALSSRAPEQLEKMAIAVAFHDLGIWTDHTFDYLQPSMRRARAHLAQTGKTEWADEIEAMILEHHKLRPYQAESDPAWLVEPFRKADWVDVSFGLVAFGLPRRFLRDLFATFPDSGFHKRLVQLAAQRLRSHPLQPMPMLRW